MAKNNILIYKQKDCYGCTVCEAVCPAKAISFAPNEEGFYYPNVDNDKCTSCGACLKVCNIDSDNLSKVLHEEPTDVYAVWSKDLYSVLKSTSGGASYHLTRCFVEDGGVVYGVAWTEHFVAAHIRVESIDELDRLRGSKYVQSKLNGVFESIKCDLKNNKKVLFVGTPCQVGGLKSFIKGRLSDNLFTVDLVCHGTPSCKMFNAYISYLEDKEKSRITSFKCRGKKATGWRAYEDVTYENGKTFTGISGRQPYFVGFNNAYFTKYKCYDCGYSQRKRCGDVTLSDFWGSEKSDKRLAKERKYGYNFFSCNSEKGKVLFDLVEEDLNVVKSSFEVAVQGDVRFRHSDALPEIRKVIYKELDAIGFEGIKRKYLGVKRLWLKRFVPEFFINMIREIQCRII